MENSLVVPLKKLKIELLYDLAISLLVIYLKQSKAGSQRDLCTLMFTAVLLNSQKAETNQLSIDR